MANLTLASSRQIALPPAQWAHDIRNLLTTIGLHLDSLARLSGPRGAKSASAMHGPEGLSINLASDGCHLVLGNHTDVFRIVFNLLHNGLSAARSGTKLRRIDISVGSEGAVIVVHVADDGGGLPARVLAGLFRAPSETGAAHGHGLAITRELAERNGGMLSCKTSRKGTVFRLELAACTSIRVAEGPVTRSLGRRAGV
jgi:K+-sensing histidine kinase KdpD